MKLLIVDDEKIIRTILSSMVQGWGYEVILASNASEAWGFLQDSNEPVIIIMDWVMPDIDGIELCKRVKEAKNEGDTYIIMLTAKNDIEDMVTGFAAGVDDFLSKPVDERELGSRLSVGSRILKYQFTLAQQNAELQATKKVMENIMRDLKEANGKLRTLSMVDGLTGIANRRKLEEFMENEWRFALREKLPLSVIMLDVDFFKLYNDTYGHQIGDICLQKVAGVLISHAMRSGDLAARYGGEEFALVLRNTDVNAARFLAEKIRIAVEALKIEHSSSGIASYVTVSLGVCALVPESGQLHQALFDCADKALYEAKRNGRNRCFYTSASEGLGRGVECAQS